MSLFTTQDKQQVYALARCGAPDMQPLLKLFNSELEEAKRALILATDTEHFRRLQGRAQALSDFLEAVQDAPSVLERF